MGDPGAVGVDSDVTEAAAASIFTTIRTCLAISGLVANTVTGVVLTNKRLWNPTSMLLLTLVAYDAIFLLASIPPSILYSVTDNETFAIILGVCYPFRFMAQTGSIYTTVTVTVERFLVVFRPLKARVFCTFGKTRKIIYGIFLFSVTFNIPRCFFYKLYTSFSYQQDFSNQTEQGSMSLSSNQSSLLQTTLEPHSFTEMLDQQSDFERENAYYMWLYLRVYELYLSGIFFYLLPYALIPILNLQLLLAIRKRREETTRISVKHEHRLRLTKPTDMEDGLTVIVLGITVCFLVCCLIPAIYMITQIADPPSHEALYYLLMATDTMLCLNASTDFLFYCLLGRKFRNVFLRTFLPKWHLKRSRTTNSSYCTHSQKNSETFYFSV